MTPQEHIAVAEESLSFFDNRPWNFPAEKVEACARLAMAHIELARYIEEHPQVVRADG